MPQIFHPSTNTFSKVSIFGSVFFIAGLSWALAVFFRSSFITKVNIPIEQPVQFSHEHHVSGLGIDCRYCHTSVEESSFAGLPPTHTCMTCHSQIWIDSPALEPVRESYRTGQPLPWNRVNDLADFVYFDHSIHVAKGVGCDECHGPVNRMPLTRKEHTLYMEWCLDCHRHPENHLRPRDQVFNLNWQPSEDRAALGQRLIDEYNIRSPDYLDDCYICHR